MRRGTVVALVLGTTLATISDIRASDDARTRDTLTGVPSVYVLVGDLSQSLMQAGLSTGTLTTDVEVQLRAAGISVAATKEEWSRIPGLPYLYINVNGHRNETRSGSVCGYSAAVELEFIQEVRLGRQPSVSVSAPTWSLGTMVGGPTVDVIRQAVRDYTDKFANAYLAANPKR